MFNDELVSPALSSSAKHFEVGPMSPRIRPSVKSAYQKMYFLISQPTHVVGTQKNRLDETVL